MPRFAANLGHLFTEYPLLERFGAAAACGFAAVELQFPYDIPAATVKAELAKHALTQLGVNTPQGPEFGLAALPGRERDFDAAFARALDYVTAIGGRRSIAWPASFRSTSGRRRRSLHRQYDARRRGGGQSGITLLIEPINPRDRSGYFLSHVEHAADLVAKIGAPNLRMQFDFYHIQIVGGDLISVSRIPAGGRSCADRRRADAPRARRGRDQLSGAVRRRRPARLCRLDRLRIQATHAHRRRLRLGQALRRRAETEPHPCVLTARPH